MDLGFWLKLVGSAAAMVKKWSQTPNFTSVRMQILIVPYK